MLIDLWPMVIFQRLSHELPGLQSCQHCLVPRLLGTPDLSGLNSATKIGNVGVKLWVFPPFFPQCVAIVWTTSHIFSKQSGVLRGRLWDNLIWVCPFFWWCLSTTPMMCVTQSTAISTKKWLHDGDLSWGYHLFPMVPVVWSYPSHSASLLTSECCRWSFQLEKLHFEGTTT